MGEHQSELNVSSFRAFFPRRKRTLHDDDETEWYFLRRKKVDRRMDNGGILSIGISGVVAALCQHRERKSRGQNKPREYRDGLMDMWHGVMLNLRNDKA